MTLKGDTLLHIQKWWYSILYAFCKSLSTNKIWSAYKSLRAYNHNIYSFLLSPDTHPKFFTAKETCEALSRALRAHIVKDNTINSSKSPKSYVKLVAHMNSGNIFDLLIYFFFVMSLQLGGLGPKAQDLVI